MPLQASISEVPGVSQSTYVEFSGEFEGESVTNFSTFWNKQVTQDRRNYFILEMSKLTTCSAEAVQCLRLFNDAVREKHGGVAIVNPSPPVIAAMRATGLGSLFTIFLEYKKAYEYLRELKEKQRQRELTERLGSGAGAGSPAEESTRVVGGAVKPPATSTPKSMQRLAQGGEATPAPRDEDSPSPSGAQTKYQLRGYTGDGRTFRGGAASDHEPITAPVLLAIPDSREYLGLRTFLVDRVEAHGLSHAFVLPLPGNEAFDWMAAGFTQAQAFVGEVSPVPATRELTAGVAVAATLARIHLAPEGILLLTNVSAPPHPVFADIPHMRYKSSKKGLEQLAGHVDQILRHVVPPG